MNYIARWQYKKGCFKEQENIQCATNTTKTIAELKECLHIGQGGMGAREYPTTADPRDILATLRTIYGQLT